MLSLIVGLAAVGLFFASPLSNLFFPHLQQQQQQRSERPQLNQSLLALGPNDTVLGCGPDGYSARILSREPLVVYLEGFLSKGEREHLLEISEPVFQPSTLSDDGSSTTHRDTTVRDSAVAEIPRTEAVQCIEARARALQGWRQDVWIEILRTQRYVAGGHYGHHFDWNANVGGWGRVSSIMAWVDADAGLEGGGTEFPLLETRAGSAFGGGKDEWCSIVECDEQEEHEASADADETRPAKRTGTTFKAVPGNAVYWENFSPDGRGYDETWHAGLPVRKGTKVGLNIWSFGRIE